MENQYYLYKYLKYKYKYISLQNDILGGKKKSKIQDSKDIIKQLQNLKITKSVFDSKTFDLLKLGIKTIPGVGSGYAIFDFILMMNTFYQNLINIINSSSALKKITVIRLKRKDNNGPNYVKQQFKHLWDSDKLTQIEKKFLCKNIRVLIKYILKLIANAVATIPTVGPIISAYLLNSNNVLTFKNVSEMFNNLPSDAKKILLDADEIRIIVNKLISEVNRKYGESGINIKLISKELKHKKHKGSGIVGMLTSHYSKQIQQNMPNFSKTTQKTLDGLKPAIEIGNVLGLNIPATKLTNFIVNTIKPGVNNGINFINIIFPLMFTLLLINETNECKNINKN